MIVSWTLAVWVPFILLFVLVTAWEVFRNGSNAFLNARSLFIRVTKRDWEIIALAFILVQVLEIILSPSSDFLTEASLLKPPVTTPPLFLPGFEIAVPIKTFFGVETKGTWWLILFWILWLVVNIFGEEILWRGYALPLQEIVFEDYAWLINGLCWNFLFHIFISWNYIVLMPISLIIPYLVQRRRNIWIGIVIHGAGNLLVLLILIPSILA